MQSCPVPPQLNRPFPDRVMAALRLDGSVFEEVERDQDAIGQAAAVIALAGVAQGIGGLEATSTVSLLAGIVATTIASFLGWVVSTAVIWLIGVKIMSGNSDFPELLRTLGFASAPKVLLLLGVLPLGPARPLLGILVVILTTVAFVMAVRHALDVSTGRAVVVCLLGIAASVFLAALFGAFLGAGLSVGERLGA